MAFRTIFMNLYIEFCGHPNTGKLLPVVVNLFDGQEQNLLISFLDNMTYFPKSTLRQKMGLCFLNVDSVNRTK